MCAGFGTFEGAFEFIEQFTLTARELDRRLDDDATVQIAETARTHVLHALPRRRNSCRSGFPAAA